MTFNECKFELMLLGYDVKTKNCTDVWFNRNIKIIDLPPEIVRSTKLIDYPRTAIRASTYQYVITQILKEYKDDP